MKFEAKNLSPVAFHALTCAEVTVSIQCFDWSKMAAEGFPVARIDEYAKPCEPAIHVLRSVADDSKASLVRVKKRTEHEPTLSPNLFFWASSTWCRRPKYFPYVHIYKAA